MILKALKYIALTPAKPVFYFNNILKEDNKSRISNIAIILAVLFVLGFQFVDKFPNISLEDFVWLSGFLVGLILTIFLDIYLIAMMISKMKRREMSFITAKIIVAFSTLPIILLFFFRIVFPFTELAPFYSIVFSLWYIILIGSGLVKLYTIKVSQAATIIFNIILIKFIFSFLFYSRIY